jgi:hypothetical protein
MSTESQTIAPRASKYDLVLMAMLVLSLSVNVALGFALARIVARPQPDTGPSGERLPIAPPLGSVVPALEGTDLVGTVATVSYGDDARPTVIYVFSPECRWCARNLPNLRALIHDKAKSYRFVGLSLDSNATAVRDYLHATGLDLTVLLNPAPSVVAALGLGVTPHTLVVSPDGRLVRSWMGAFTGTNATDVESYFGLKLPGLTRPAAPPIQQ